MVGRYFVTSWLPLIKGWRSADGLSFTSLPPPGTHMCCLARAERPLGFLGAAKAGRGKSLLHFELANQEASAKRRR